MKKDDESSPEFSLTFTHCGVSVSISGKLIAADLLTTAEPGSENESHLGRVLNSSLPEAARLAAESLQKFHSEFEQVVRQSMAGDYLENVFPLQKQKQDIFQEGINKVKDTL